MFLAIVHLTGTSPAHLRVSGLWELGPSRMDCICMMDLSFASPLPHAESPDGPVLHQSRVKCREPALALSQQAASCPFV